MTRQIHCCDCNADVAARLTDGTEIYPHRPDLATVPLWRCDTCGNYVGCHHRDTKNPTVPLGCIPTPEILKMRIQIHAAVDPIWKSGRLKRGAIYGKISKALGRGYHTANIRSMDEATQVMEIIKTL